MAPPNIIPNIIDADAARRPEVSTPVDRSFTYVSHQPCPAYLKSEPGIFDIYTFPGRVPKMTNTTR